ncbi:MAG: hypothetical protein U0992_11470 [Planctomycetaceae bacterium]
MAQIYEICADSGLVVLIASSRRWSLLARVGEDFTFDLGFGAEIQEQTDFDVGRPQIVQQLGFVRLAQRFDRLQLDDHQSVNDQVRKKVPITPSKWTSTRVSVIDMLPAAFSTSSSMRSGKRIPESQIPNEL